MCLLFERSVRRRRGIMASLRPPQCVLSPSLRVLPDVGEGRGAGVVAKDFIKAGTLLARTSSPLVWSTRVAPDCPWGLSGAASRALLLPTSPSKECSSNSSSRSNSCAVTACDGCLRPYDHSRNIYSAAGRGTGASAKRCSACKVVSYCSTDCQRSAWTRHRRECALFNRKFKKAGRSKQEDLLAPFLQRCTLEQSAGASLP